MILTLFLVFLVLSLILIALGLFRTEHTELSLIGFFFLFLLSLVILGGQIQYKTGVIYNYGCLCCGEYLDEEQRPIFGAHNCSDVTNSSLVITSMSDNYETWEGGGTLSHTVGYWMAIASVAGFAGVLWGLARTNWRKT